MFRFNRMAGRIELHQVILAGDRKGEGRKDSASHLSSTIRLYIIAQLNFAGLCIRLFVRTFSLQKPSAIQ